MKTGHLIIIALLAWVALYSPQAWGQTANLKFVSAAHMSSEGETYHGYLPHRFDIHNWHTSRTYDVRIALMTYQGKTLEKTVSVQPGTRLQAIIYQPAIGFSGLRSFTISAPGLGTTAPVHFPRNNHGQNNYHYNYFTHSGMRTSWLFSRRFKTETFEDATAEALYPATAVAASPPAHGFGVGGSGTVDKVTRCSRSPDDVADWPADWLAYSPYDGVAIHAEEYAACREKAVQEALENYILGGGVLVVFGAEKNVTEDIGLGQRRFYTAQAPENLTAEALKDLQVSLSAYAKFWLDRRTSVTDHHKLLPIIDKLDIPFRSFLGTMAVFAILMGPVAIGVLSRKNRRIWLLWLIPAMSILTSGFVYVSNLIREGTDKVAVARNVVYLDQPRNMAVSLGWTGYYSPRNVHAIQYPTSTEVTPLDQSMSYGYGKTGSVIFGDQQLFVNGWTQPRIPIYFATRDIAPNRERVRIEKDGVDYYALNGLSVELKWLSVELNGDIWTYQQSIPAGARVKLGSQKGKPSVGNFRRVFGDGNSFPKTVAGFASDVPQGHYVGLTSVPYRVTNGIEKDGTVAGYSAILGRVE